MYCLPNNVDTPTGHYLHSQFIALSGRTRLYTTLHLVIDIYPKHGPKAIQERKEPSSERYVSSFHSNKTLLTVIIIAWGPTFTGLGVVPILPYLYDHPVENGTEWAFDWIAEKVRGRESSSAAATNNKEL